MPLISPLRHAPEPGFFELVLRRLFLLMASNRRHILPRKRDAHAIIWYNNTHHAMSACQGEDQCTISAPHVSPQS